MSDSFIHEPVMDEAEKASEAEEAAKLRHKLASCSLAQQVPAHLVTLR